MPAGGKEVNRPEAIRLAAAFVRTHGSSVVGFLTKERGAAISLAALRPCGRAVYAASPFDAASDDTPGFARRAVGSWWIVPLCEQSEVPVALVGVSAHNVGTVGVDPAGRLEYYPVEGGGNEFRWRGVPVADTAPLVVSPERAVRFGAHVSGRAVSRVPELIAPEWTQGNVFDAHWRLTLDAPARLAAAGGERAVSDVFVGTPPRGKSPVALASREQPAGATLDYLGLGPVVGAGTPTEHRASVRQSLTVRRRQDVPTRFEPTTSTGATP